jgi:tripartite-type tricarboxylate transporter receptor subunit TctC
MKNALVTALGLLACCLLSPAAAQAQGATAAASGDAAADYPQRPVRVIVPFAPGGATDTVARQVAQRLGERLGQTFIVENKPGGANIIGNDTVAKAAPDGYTLLFAAAPLAMNKVLGLKTPYDPLKDFAPISLVASGGVLILAHPSSPYRTMKDIVEAAKATPDGLFYATAGVGSMPHLIGEYWKVESGVNLTHVGFKGSAPAVQAAVSGEVKVLIDGFTATINQIESGKLRPIAYAGRARSPLRPDVPTTAEQGFPQLVGGGFFGLLAPAGTPKPIIDKIHAEVKSIAGEADFRERNKKVGYEVHGTTPDEYAAYLREQIDRWTPIAKAANLKPE